MTFKERLFLAMAHKAPWLRYCITLCFLALCIFLWWFLSYRHMSVQVFQMQQRMHEREQYSAQQTLLLRKQTVAQVEAQTHEQTVRKAWESFFVCKQTTTFVEQLVATAQEYKLRLTSYHLSEPRIQTWGKRVELTCDLTGDFFSLILLFEQLELMTNVISLNCEIQSIQDQSVHCKCTFALLVP